MAGFQKLPAASISAQNENINDTSLLTIDKTYGIFPIPTCPHTYKLKPFCGICKAVSTVSRNLASLRSFYQYLYKTKVIVEDPTINLESPKIERKLPKVLTSEQVELLLEQPKSVDLKGYRDKRLFRRCTTLP